jgi:hypothetical protein
LARLRLVAYSPNGGSGKVCVQGADMLS